MAIVNNTLSEIGDVLIVKVQLAIRGEIQFTNFTEDLEGVTVDRFFKKTFRYSKDRLNWTDWSPLTLLSIQDITGKIPGLLFMEFSYERVGSNTTGLLIFNNINIEGDIDIQVCLNTATVESIFEELSCNDQLTSEIANNLLRKIYFSGILPEFIDRGEGIDDEDFISFWGAVTFFVSMIISFANTFDEILYRRNYLIEHLRQRGLVLCGEETPIEDLQYLANNFKDEVRKRGTAFISKEKGEKTRNGDTTKVRGEWLRLLCKNHYDEFLYELIKKENMGYNIGNSSMLYNGTNQSNQINKTEENTGDFIDLNLYETNGNVDIIGGNLIIGGGNPFNGIGFDKDNPPIDTSIDRLITIDPEMDYEITFKIERPANSDINLNFGVHGFNRNGASKPLSFLKTDSSQQVSSSFLSIGNVSEVFRIPNQSYFVRGIIYADRSKILSDSDSKLNIGFGNSLKFKNNIDCEKLKIYIQTNSNDNTKSLSIHDLKMRPLIRGKNIHERIVTPEGTRPIQKIIDPFIRNPQFIQKGLTILSWMKNNNEEKTDSEIINFLERYLIPYQHKIVGIFLSPKVEDKQLLT